MKEEEIKKTAALDSLEEIISWVIDRHPIISIDDFTRIYAKVTEIHGSGKFIQGEEYGEFMRMKYKDTKERLTRLYEARRNYKEGVYNVYRGRNNKLS
jgi:hypothetical protein